MLSAESDNMGRRRSVDRVNKAIKNYFLSLRKEFQSHLPVKSE